MLPPNPTPSTRPHLLNLPTEVRCLIYTHLLPPPSELPQLHLLQTERHTILASFPTQTAFYQCSRFNWLFYHMIPHPPSSSPTAQPTHTTTVAHAGHRESAHKLIHWLHETIPSGSTRMSDQRELFTHLYGHLVGFPPVGHGEVLKVRYEQPVRLRERPNMYWFDRYRNTRIEVLEDARAMMEVCSRTREEFRDWLFSTYEVYLEHGLYTGNYALPPSAQAVRACPDVRRLVMVFNIGDDVQIMESQLGKLRGLTSLRLQVTCDHELLRAHVEIRTEAEIRAYQAAATGALVRVASQLGRLVEFKMFSVRKGLMKWVRGEEMEKAVLRAIECRRKK